jgi:hypothetical protein
MVAKEVMFPGQKEEVAKKTHVRHGTGTVNEIIRLDCACSEAVLQNDQL